MRDKADLLFIAICERLRKVGLCSRAAAMVTYAMAVEGLTYEAARDVYAEWIGEAPERLQADLCYDVLQAGHEVSPAKLLGDLIGEGVKG